MKFIKKNFFENFLKNKGWLDNLKGLGLAGWHLLVPGTHTKVEKHSTELSTQILYTET